MKTLVANSLLGIISVSSVLVLIVVHEVLAAIAGGPDRFVLAKRWLTTITAVLIVILALLIIARFYYLRT